jgi:hypothetical protein
VASSQQSKNRQAMKLTTLLSLAAVLPLALDPAAAMADTPDAPAIRNPSIAFEGRGQLRVSTPDRKRWQSTWEDYVWENPNYRVYREDGSKVRTGYHRRLLTLDAGAYQVKLVGCSAPPARVVIEPGRITEITMTD